MRSYCCWRVGVLVCPLLAPQVCVDSTVHGPRCHKAGCGVDDTLITVLPTAAAHTCVGGVSWHVCFSSGLCVRLLCSHAARAVPCSGMGVQDVW
jgi:hypothetical protein